MRGAPSPATAIQISLKQPVLNLLSCLFLYLPICSQLYMRVFVSNFLFAYLSYENIILYVGVLQVYGCSICKLVFLSCYLSVHLPICLSVCLSMFTIIVSAVGHFPNRPCHCIQGDATFVHFLQSRIYDIMLRFSDHALTTDA